MLDLICHECTEENEDGVEVEFYLSGWFCGIPAYQCECCTNFFFDYGSDEDEE